MSVAKTKTAGRKRPVRPRRPRVKRAERRRDDLSHAYVVRDDQATHVLIPVEEYERLVMADMAREAVAKLEDPNTEWIDFDDYKLQLAGSKIAEARKARKLTQTQLAKKLGVPQSQISRIERHPDQTTVRTLKRIAKALGVDVKMLVG